MLMVWCSIVDALQTSSISAVNDYKLSYLVKMFDLSEKLLSNNYY